MDCSLGFQTNLTLNVLKHSHPHDNLDKKVIQRAGHLNKKRHVLIVYNSTNSGENKSGINSGRTTFCIKNTVFFYVPKH